MENKKEHTLYADGFDDAILGFSHEWTDTPKVVYSKLKMIEVCEEEGMSVDEAIEYLEYNVWGAYVGDGTPIYADDLAGTKREDIEYTLTYIWVEMVVGITLPFLYVLLRTPHNLVRATPMATPPRRGNPLKTTPPRTAEAVAMKMSEVNTDLILSVIFMLLFFNNFI